MSECAFSYNISRPYPYRWFTIVAIIGGIVLGVLFSLLNFALNGYEPVAYSFKQPHEPNLLWYYGLATLQSDSLKPNCTAVDFPINSQFFTNQSGLTYTLDAVWTGSRDDSEGEGQSPSLSYSNEPFRNSSIFLINMDMEELDRDANQVLTAPWGLVVRAFTTCTLQDKATGLETYVNLTTAFDAVPEGNSLPQLSKPKWLVATNRYQSLPQS